MIEYKRIKLKLEDLPPQSVSKVFIFIEELFDNGFDVHHFEKEILTYNNGEKYFTYYYLKKYLSDDYLNKIFSESEDDLQRYTTENIKTIETLIDKTIKTVERRYKKEIHNGKYKHPIIAENTFNKRIPLYFTLNKTEYKKLLNKDTIRITDKFKVKIKEILKEDISENDFESFFNNSFSYPNNISDIKPLFIEIDNSRRLYKNMYNVYQYYNNILNKEYKRLEGRYNAAVENKKAIKEEKEKYGSIKPKEFKKLIKFDKRIKPQKLKRIDLMLIMYNAFPQIRESTTSYLKDNQSVDVMDYLRIKCKNLKK